MHVEPPPLWGRKEFAGYAAAATAAESTSSSAASVAQHIHCCGATKNFAAAAVLQQHWELVLM
jgi:hypothetical protein